MRDFEGSLGTCRSCQVFISIGKFWLATLKPTPECPCCSPEVLVELQDDPLCLWLVPTWPFWLQDTSLAPSGTVLLRAWQEKPAALRGSWARAVPLEGIILSIKHTTGPGSGLVTGGGRRHSGKHRGGGAEPQPGCCWCRSGSKTRSWWVQPRDMIHCQCWEPCQMLKPFHGPASSPGVRNKVQLPMHSPALGEDRCHSSLVPAHPSEDNWPKSTQTHSVRGFF